MAKHAPKCKAAECEECPEWIFTFADLVMLMMGFFVILWVTKPAGKSGSTEKEQAQAEKQWMETIGEIRKEFGHVPDAKSGDRIDDYMIKKAKGIKQGNENETPRETAPGTDKQVTSLRAGKVSAVGSRMMFEAGSPRLLPETTHALDGIIEKIRGHNNIIMVKGHTSLDDLGEKATGQQKMDLSLRRAQAVADYLLSKGIAPEAVRVQGCSTYEPVRQRAYSAEAQAENRRVEVESIAEMVEERQDNGEPKPVGEEKAEPQAKPAHGGHE